MKVGWFILIVISGAWFAGGCANMAVLPDENAEAFASEAALTTPAFKKASVAINGTWYGQERGTPGAMVAAEQQGWHAVRAALAEKQIAAEVEGAGLPGELTILFEFMLEDDSHPLHTGFSRLSLYLFPEWKMVRLSVRARCRVKGESIPDFDFEEEKLIYKSPLLLPVSPFAGGSAVEQLFDAAGRALAVHLVKNLRLFFPVLLRAHETPFHE